jgi:type I restriction enzyme S subunit
MNDGRPQGWAACTLGDLFDFKYGKGLPQEKRNEEGSVTVYGSNGVVGVHNAAVTRGPTIVVGRKGSVGEVHLSPEACWPIDTTYFIDDFPANLPPSYWALYLKSLHLGQQEKSSAIPGISRDDIYSVEVQLPPLGEQQRIVSRLEKLLDKVDASQQRLAKIPVLLKRFRQSVLGGACSGRLTADWREKNPQIERASDMLQAHAGRTEGRERNTRRMKPAKGLSLLDYSEEFPTTWTWLKVRQLVEKGAIFDVQDGNHGELYPRAEDFGDAGVRYISAEHVINDRVQIDSAPFLKNEKAQQLRIGFAKANDVILTHNATVGRVALLPPGSSDVVLSTSTTYYRVDEAVLLARYLATFLRSHFFQSQLEAVMEQTTRNQVSVTKQVEFGIAVPPLAEQQEIVLRVEGLFGVADQIESRYAKAKAHVEKLPQSILAKAFRGEVVPQDPNDEPASELLKRIKLHNAGSKR